MITKGVNTKMNPKTNERNYGIDLYRIVCMVMIPCLHIMGWGGTVRNCSVNVEQ